MWDKLLSVYEQSSGQRLDMLYNQFFNFKKDPTDDISKHISKLESLWNDMQNELTKQENLKLPESMLMCRIINTLPDEYFDFKSVWESVSKEERSVDNLTQRLRLLEIRIQQRDECSASSSTALMANAYENKQNMKEKATKSNEKFQKTIETRECYFCHRKGHLAKDCSRNVMSLQSTLDKGFEMKMDKKGCKLFKTTTGEVIVEGKRLPGGLYEQDQHKLRERHLMNYGLIKKTAVDHLRIFGTECFVHVPDEKRRKLDAKSEKGILVGYCSNKDGYQIWMPNSNKVVTSRDVIFKETIPTVSLDIEKRNKELSSNQIDEQNDTQDIEKIESNVQTSDVYNLRDRSNISKPQRYIDAEINIAEGLEPKIYKEAMDSPNAQFRKEAMNEEMNSLTENDVFEYTTLPPGQKPIDCKWVLKTKLNSKGEITRYKARLVAKGFAQKKGIDYEETFSPVARHDTIRTLLAIAANEDLKLVQFDIKTAFLYGDLQDRIYIKRPEGFNNGTDLAWKLKKSLYGLKQSPRCWNQKIVNFIKERCLKEKSKAIEHELTIPYTPRSNGRIERANRTLLDKGRTLLADSQLPLHFWAEAVNTAAYLYNLTPTTNDPDTTPMEKWKGKKPSISHIMRFGCEVFYKLENHQRHKLEAKSKRGIFVGYSRCRRAYRVFDITARVILETADIHFRENNNGILEEKQSDNNTDTYTYFFIQEDEQLDNHVLSDVDIEEPAPDTMINRQTESSESDRPQRTRTIPKRFDDYVLATTNETIPKNYEEAIACEDKKQWENAMLEEIQNMYSHQVWELVPRPVNAKVVKSKWVFKISKDQENKTYKARLVAMGYNQIPGRDYNESFSPVIKNATLRTILSMAATKDSVLKLFDVKAAYLNGNIENTIFMEQPAGFVQDRNKVCKLNKSIYDPDIAYITSKLSQYSRQPKQMHWTAIKRVMRYLRGTIDLGVKFERGKTGILKSYTDASWSTTHDGKSYSGYVLKLGEATIDWKSSKQPLVTLSTMEAEMIAACESFCQIKWIINLLRELEEWNFMEKPTAIYTDSH
ncbi:hypothetical protein LAZ67_12000762 [Cordylochernes scorpioides]|uniref:Retrovirus-related Pol polyprotein from transposon TNT 1-94 n=1 Tax=Cordylochernes scorpioides TaxID=51811 RepID=A0ABY6L0U4_9ARAC|nr:hypothetical protein LAZ67_12000762 [Cordylochernes scorpioides]